MSGFQHFIKSQATKVLSFFQNVVNWSVLKSSLNEVIWLTFIALLPLIVNIIIARISLGSFHAAIGTKVIPGEVLSYCMSFIAPSLYILIKAQGTSYKLPLLHIFSLITISIYLLSFALYIIAKNKWVENVNMEELKVHNADFFFKLILYFLFITIIFRIYSIYHSKNMSNWSETRKEQQEDFNDTFVNSLNKPK